MRRRATPSATASRAVITILPTEKQADLDQLIRATREEFRPATGVEHCSCDRMIHGASKLARVRRLQAEAFDYVIEHATQGVDRAIIADLENPKSALGRLERYATAAPALPAAGLDSVRSNAAVQNEATAAPALQPAVGPSLAGSPYAHRYPALPQTIEPGRHKKTSPACRYVDESKRSALFVHEAAAVAAPRLPAGQRDPAGEFKPVKDN